MVDRFRAKFPHYPFQTMTDDDCIFRNDIEHFLLQEVERARGEERERLLYELGKNTKIAELKTDDEEQLWARIDTSFSDKPKGRILLIDEDLLTLLDN
jgi:hypothetical protein